MLKRLALLLFAAMACYASQAQFYYQEGEEEKSVVNFGFGLGLGYGGLGCRLSALPAQPIALFAGLGYNFNGAGWNLGAALRLLPEKRVVPTLTAMYGYNAVIVVQGASEYNGTYYGASFGGGLELHTRRGQDYFNFELIIPARSQKFQDDFDKVANDPNIEISEPFPFTLGVGYHYKF